MAIALCIRVIQRDKVDALHADMMLSRQKNL